MRNAARFAAIDANIELMDRRLESITRQQAVLGEKVQLLGRYVDVTLDELQDHTRDGHGPQDDE